MATPSYKRTLFFIPDGSAYMYDIDIDVGIDVDVDMCEYVHLCMCVCVCVCVCKKELIRITRKEGRSGIS